MVLGIRLTSEDVQTQTVNKQGGKLLHLFRLQYITALDSIKNIFTKQINIV